jgi:hypothetical protein
MLHVLALSWLGTMAATCWLSYFSCRYVFWSAAKRVEKDSPMIGYMAMAFGIVSVTGIALMVITAGFRWSIG